MALTAQASHAHLGIGRHNGPGWDETIVPTLRKRLEGESRVLSKRMSSQSIPSADEYLSEAQVHSSNNRMASPRHTLEIPRPDPQRTSAIPRPNYQQPTPAPSQVLESPSPRITPTDPSPRTHIPSGSTSSSSKSAAKRTTRARTQSTPYPFYGRDSNTANPDSRGAMPTPGSSRAASPMTQGRPSDVRPSRIPVLPARARSGSRPTPPNLTVFKDREPTNDLPRSAGLDDRLPGNHPRIRDEKAPFPSQRTELSFEQEQEHQFEHWYRGEGRDGGGRNGGIGEIKVGTREMLQIAVAGHQSGTLERRRAAGWVNDAEYSISGRSIGRAQTDELVWEINNRDSRVFDDSAELQRWERVLDETPLTDVDADVTDVDMGPAANHREVEEARSVTPALQVPLERKAPTTPTNKSNGIADPTTPRQPATATVKPSLSVRNGSGPSPKAKPAVRKPKPPPKRSVVESSLSPRGDLLADAIPSVSLPSITSGNWDEVVLPTVARKIHLQKLADGSLTEEELRAHNGRGPPQPQREEVIPPAPGTFGYDASKIRTPRILGGEIQMDEFGARTLYEEDEPAPLPTPPSAPPPPVLADDRPIRPLSMDLDRPESPAPFSSYVIPDQRMFALEERGSKAKLKGLKKNKPAITVTSPSQEPETMTFVREEKGEEHVGCCARCVIM